MGKNSSFILLILSLFAFIQGCYKEPSFDTKPEISFKNIDKQIRIDPFTGANKDSLIISISFKDGDGDLGFSETEKDSAEKLSNYNYVVKAFRQQKGKLTEIKSDIPYSGYFPRLTSDDKKRPIEGVLDYSLDFPHPFTPKKDSVQFQIFVKDRAGNVSNTVITKMIILNEF